jgi:hypothetical protein
MPTPDAGNLSLGAGEVLFDRFDASGNPTGYRHLGNVESLAITTTVETVQKKSSMDGARGIYKEAVIGSEAEVSMVLSEYDPENLALALLGDTATFSQASGGPATGQQINNGNPLKFDRWYYLGKKQVTVTAVKQGAQTGVLGTDYELNTELGLIKIKSGGVFTEAVTTWDGSWASVTATQVRGLTVGKIEGRLKYFSAANQASGPRWEVDIHKLTINPDGELQLISEEFGTFTLRGKAQKDSTKPAGEQFFVARKL